MNINTKKYYDYESIGGGVPEDRVENARHLLKLRAEEDFMSSGSFSAISIGLAGISYVRYNAIAKLMVEFSDSENSLSTEKLKEQEQEIERLKAENERLRGEVDIPTAIRVLTKALLEDKSEGSYYYSWQANISMSFIDEYQRLNPHMSDGNKHILHGIANEAAKNFLDLLCLTTPSPTTKK